MRYTDSGLTPRTTVYAEREMLKHARPVEVLAKFGKAVQMPKNKSATIKFRRPVNFTAKTVPLVEGVTPDKTNFSYEDVSATLKQYGDVVETTDVIADLHEDPVGKDASMICGENIGRTMEALNWAVVRAGTNVVYANGVSRSAVNTVITLNKQRAVVRSLKAQKATKITSILAPSPNYETRAVEAAFVAVAHTNLESDIRNLAGFVPVAEYGQRQPISEFEIGSVEDVRYVLSPDLEPFLQAGASSSTMLTNGASGTGNADVYPVIYLGKDAWGHVALRGQGAISPTMIPVDQRTKDDPLGQRGYIGWKGYHTAVILNDLWMARLEVAVTAL